jgi:hypothetical protein
MPWLLAQEAQQGVLNGQGGMSHEGNQKSNIQLMNKPEEL